MRIDSGTLRPPSRTAQGFLRVDGLVARAGIYEYINTPEDEADGLGRAGTTRYELRPEEEVFREDVMGGYEGAPITVMHPKKMLDPQNVRTFEVGSVSGPGRRDGNEVGVSMVIKDARAIERVDRRELVQLSPGYRCKLEMKSGFAPQYATKTNPRGFFNFVQRDIVVNHLALVDRARGGDNLQIRMDRADLPGGCSVERTDCGCGSPEPSLHEIAAKMFDNLMGIGKLVTTSVDGHQHVLEAQSGRTSYAVSVGSEGGHDHAFARNPDGTWTVLENAGHTHEVVELAASAEQPQVPIVVIEVQGAEVEAEREDGEWSEDDHPRDDNGKFGSGGGGGGGSSAGKSQSEPKKGGGKSKGPGKAPAKSVDQAMKESDEAEDKHNALVKSLGSDKSLSAEKQIHESHLNRIAAQKEVAKALGDRAALKSAGYAEEDAHSQHATNASKLAHASGSAEDHEYARQANEKASSMSPKGSGRERGHAAKAAEHADKVRQASVKSDAAVARVEAGKSVDAPTSEEREGHALNAIAHGAAAFANTTGAEHSAKAESASKTADRENTAQAHRAAAQAHRTAASKHSLSGDEAKAKEHAAESASHNEHADKLGAHESSKYVREKAITAHLQKNGYMSKLPADLPAVKDHPGQRSSSGVRSQAEIDKDPAGATRAESDAGRSGYGLASKASLGAKRSAKRRDEADEPISASVSSQRLDGMRPSMRPVAEGATTMDAEEQIRVLKAQLAESEKLAAQRTQELTTAVERGDRAEATIKTLEEAGRELEAKLAAGAHAMETQAIREQAERADRAEETVRNNAERFDSAVRERTGVIRRAMVIMGDEFNPDRMTNREIQSIVVKRLDAAADISAKVTDAYIAGRFDSLVELHQKTARSLTRASSVLTTTASRADRADANGQDDRVKRADNWRNQWKQPLPSSRDSRGKKEA